MIGCLCLHGFTGSPWELEPLAERLKEQRDWVVQTPVLPGHREEENIKEYSYRAWMEEAEITAQKLFSSCDKVYVIGFSMGGMLACYIAAHYPVSRLVLLGAAAQYIGVRQLVKDMAVILESGIKGQMKNHPWYTILNEKIHTPLRSVGEFQRAVKTITPLLQKVKVPTFIGQGVQDGLVPQKSAYYLYEKIHAPVKQLYFYEQSKHFLCHGMNRSQVIEDVEHFLFTDSLKSEQIWKSTEHNQIKDEE